MSSSFVQPNDIDLLSTVGWNATTKILLVSVIVPCVLVVLAAAFTRFKDFYVIWKTLRKMPGPPFYYVMLIHWSLVRMSEFMDYSLAATWVALGYIGSVFRDQGYRIFKVYIGFKAFVILYTPEAIEEVLKSTTGTINKSFMYDLFRFWLGDSLLLSRSHVWKKKRKLLTPSFHFKLLEDFIPVMNEHSMVLVKKLHSTSKKNYVDFLPLASSCTLDTLCETAMGVSLNSQKDSQCPYLLAIKGVSSSFIYRIARPWFWFEPLYFVTRKGREVRRKVNFIHNFIDEIIKSRKAHLEKHGTDSQLQQQKRVPFLDILLTYHLNDLSLTERDIREEVDTFMFEGHDTTSSGLSYTLYLLGQHSDIQCKVYDEIRNIFGDDKSRPVTLEDLKALTYLECVIKESLRLYPPVPIIARNIEEDTEIEGYPVPKGSTVNVIIYTLHHDKNIYPKPEEFIPERFLPENSKGRHPYAFIPFSAGPRNCIGQRFAFNQLKIIITNLMRNFTVQSLDPQEEMIFSWELVVRPKKMRLSFIPR